MRRADGPLKVRVPIYLLASREDHIVPWQSAYRSKGLIGKEPRFVLAASGHVAGVINPPARNKRSYWTHDDLSGDAADWLDKAEEKAGQLVAGLGRMDEAPVKRDRCGPGAGPATPDIRRSSRRPGAM